MAPLYAYKAQVVDIIDGDTLLVHVDLGFYIWTMLPVRLTGLEHDPHNALDVKREDQTVGYLKDLFADEDRVTIETHIHDAGYWQADIILNGRTVNQDLERLGLLRGTGRRLASVH